jgi:NitT/TauT family transport system substrate-binding protein
MRRWLALCVVLVCVICVPGALAAPTMDHVKVRLDWLIRGNHAPFFVAMDKGYFRDQGIQVDTIDKGNGSVNTMTLVGSGQYDFGFGDLPTLVVAKAKGVPVTSIIVVNQQSPLAMIALKGTGLHTPKDLEGKVVGIQPSGSTFVFYLAFLAANHVDRSKITEETIPVPYEEFLLTRKVQVIPGYIDAELPELEAKAGGMGSLEVILGAKYGYDGYGSGVLTSDQMIKNHPDLVRRFTRAYLRGFQDVTRNIREAADILAKYNPEVAEKRDVMIEQLSQDVQFTFTSADTKAHGLGWQSADRWRYTIGIMTQQGVITVPLRPQDVYTDEFLM